MIVFSCSVLLLMITFTNYWRIERMAHDQRELLAQARKEINALNTIMLMRFKKKQRIEYDLLMKIVERLERIEQHSISKDLDMMLDIDNLKSTLQTLLHDEKILYDYSETQARLRESALADMQA